MDVSIPSKKLIARTFSKRASRYCETAFIQRRILRRLVQLIIENMPSGRPLLDAGCGAGLLGTLLKEKRIPMTLFHSDIAIDALARLKSGSPLAVQSDVEVLPFKDSVFGGIVSSSVFQWLDNAEKAAAETCRVLADSGVLFFSVYLEDSFSQVLSLRRKRNLSIPVRLFKREGFTSLLAAAGFKDIKTETLREEYYFSSGRDAVKFLSDIGSTAVPGRRLGRRELESLYDDYEYSFSTAVGVPFTVHVALGTARKRK